MTHCTHEQSQALKEIGFDMPTRDYYTRAGGIKNNASAHDWNIHFITSAPTPYEILDWFRETKGIDAWVESIFDFDNEKKYIFIIHKHDDSRMHFTTHTEALSALIDKLITILEEQKA